MVMRIRPSFWLLAGLVLASGLSVAQAGEMRRHHRHHDQWDNQPSQSINIIPGNGTYSGSITVYHADGIGTSTWLQGVRSAHKAPREIVMKIIEVKADGSNSACSMEEGVCVIRP